MRETKAGGMRERAWWRGWVVEGDRGKGGKMGGGGEITETVKKRNRERETERN